MNLKKSLLLSGLALPLVGCNLLLGLDEPEPYPTTTTTTTGTTTTTTDEGGGGAGGTTTSGTGGSGGACDDGEVMACYDGPPGTQEVGACKDGQQTCQGGAFGACMGAVFPGEETCGSTADEDCDGKDCLRWAVVFGDESEQYALDVAVDSSGSVYVLGAFTGTLDFGNAALIAGGATDLFLAKLDSTGKHLWSKQYANPSLGDPPAGFLADLDVRGDGEIVMALPFAGSIDLGTGQLAAEGFSDISVARLDTDGNTLWSKRFGGVGIDSLAGIGFVKDGSVMLSGSYAFTIDFGGGPLDSDGGKESYIAKLTADSGDHVWSTRIGGLANQYIEAQALDSAGSVTVMGFLTGDTVICGQTLTVQSPDRDLFAARFDGDMGGCEWVNQYAGTGTYGTVKATADALGGVTVAGLLDGSLNFGGGAVVSAGPSGSPDVFLFKLSVTDGGYQWSKSFQSANAEDATGGLVANIDEQLVFSMQSDGAVSFTDGVLQSAGAQDVFFGKMAPDGTSLWTRRMGDAADQSNSHVALFPDGDILLTATVSGTVDLGGGPIPTKGSDLLIARLAP